jgi:DNA-binding response OmpR family regulator
MDLFELFKCFRGPSVVKEAQTFREPICLTAVLLIDQSKQDSLFIQQTFEKKYYQVFTVPSGEEGLRVAELVRFDLIILDYDLPGLNGLEVCKMLKANPKTREIPLLFYTKEENGMVIECYEAGADLYLHRSVPPKLMLEEVESLLAEIKSQKELKELRRKN